MSCPQHTKRVVIRHPKSNLVLDGSGPQVTIQVYNQSIYQYWTLECVDYAKFIVTNVGNGLVLDIDHGATSGARLITFQRHGGPNQQWRFESDKTIVSGDTSLVVDIIESRYQPGSFLDVYRKTLTDNQIFWLEYY